MKKFVPIERHYEPEKVSLWGFLYKGDEIDLSKICHIEIVGKAIKPYRIWAVSMFPKKLPLCASTIELDDDNNIVGSKLNDKEFGLKCHKTYYKM